MTHDTTIIALTGALFAIGGMRGAYPHWREHRQIRKDARKHRRTMWLRLRDLGYDVMPWSMCKRRGPLLQDNTWNELRAQLEEQDREARRESRHG